MRAGLSQMTNIVLRDTVCSTEVIIRAYPISRADHFARWIGVGVGVHTLLPVHTK